MVAAWWLVFSIPLFRHVPEPPRTGDAASAAGAASAFTAGVFGTGASFHSLQHAHPARIDFYRARIVDGLGQTVHERLFAVETDHRGERHLREPGLIGNFVPAEAPEALPEVATAPEPAAWLHRHALAPFLEDTRRERLTEIGRVASHVELSLTELLLRADEEIGKADEDRDQGVPGAEGRLARAEQSRGDVFPEADTMMNNCFPPGDPQ